MSWRPGLIEIPAILLSPRPKSRPRLLKTKDKKVGVNQSRRQVVELLQERCGVKVCPGSIQSRCEETSEALETPYREAKEAVVQAETAPLDETGRWRASLRFGLNISTNYE